jgi:prolyl 4-hydroxylase
LAAAAAAAALRRSEPQRQAGVAAQRAAVDESFEEARWRCYSRTLANSAAMAGGFSASHAASHQLRCDHSGSGGINAAGEISSLGSGRNLTTSCNAATISPNTSIARYTQLPSPVAVPPNSISLIYLHSFLSVDECAKLIELSEGKFSRSQVGFKAATGHTSDSRTSHSAALSQSDPAVMAVRHRVAELTGARDEQIQTLSVVRYMPGQQYQPHYDSYGSSSIPPRRWTIFAYLNDLPDGAGGETEFTKIGVKFKPKQGDALLWENQPNRSSYIWTANTRAGRRSAESNTVSRFCCSQVGARISSLSP